MKFGVCIPNFGSIASAKACLEVTKEAENLGFDSIWSSDHILVRKEYSYPYGNTLEALDILSYLSSQTLNVKLGTSVLILTQRNPIIIAKRIATIDNLSNGRVVLGLGFGWMKEEFDYLNASFEDRYERLEEYVELMKALWNGKEEFKGNFYSFSNVYFEPKPVQEKIPIWLGGNSSKVIENVTKFADGWQPIGLSVNDFAKKVSKLRNISRKDVVVSLRMNIRIGGEESILRLPTGKIRYKIVGKASSIIEQISNYKEKGLDYLICYFEDVSIEDNIEQMKIFAKDVIPSL